MTNQHPITPPPELVEDWIEMAKLTPKRPPNPNELATIAARWGADQELDAGRDFLERELWGRCEHHIGDLLEKLYAERRPKPLTLKEQALARTDAILNDPNCALLVEVRETLEMNRRALEQLPDDQRTLMPEFLNSLPTNHPQRNSK